MRVYLPATVPMLRAALATGEFGSAPLTGFAVTPALREWYAAGDAEELEYAALTEAARASLRLLDVDQAAPQRRVVLAAEVPERAVTPLADLDRAAVRLAAAVPRAAWVSAHVDDPLAAEVIAVAAAAVVAADLGDDDAQFAVDEAEGCELQWYAVQELPGLVG